jgi:hypothetical protein
VVKEPGEMLCHQTAPHPSLQAALPNLKWQHYLHHLEEYPLMDKYPLRILKANENLYGCETITYKITVPKPSTYIK